MRSFRKELFKRAMQAPPDVDQVEGPDGAYIRITREGAIARRLDLFDAEDVLESSTWEYRPAQSPAASYPDHLPFIPDLICTVTESNNRRMVGWFTEATEDGLADLKESVSRIKVGAAPELSQMVKTFLAELKASKKTPQGIESLLDALPIDPEYLREIGEKIFATPPPDAAEKLEGAFDQVMGELQEAGWEQTNDPQSGLGSFGRGVSLRLGEARRFLMLMAIGGGGYVMLHETAADPTEG